MILIYINTSSLQHCIADWTSHTTLGIIHVRDELHGRFECCLVFACETATAHFVWAALPLEQFNESSKCQSHKQTSISVPLRWDRRQTLRLAWHDHYWFPGDCLCLSRPMITHTPIWLPPEGKETVRLIENYRVALFNKHIFGKPGCWCNSCDTVRESSSCTVCLFARSSLTACWWICCWAGVLLYCGKVLRLTAQLFPSLYFL